METVSLDDQIEMLLEQSELQQADDCVNKAPCIAILKDAGWWEVVQGCCNDWTCPRCGHIRARHEYGRIVNGAKVLAERESLFFLTLTCRGGSMSVEDAQEDYLLWTNRLLTTLRANAKKKEIAWVYVQVTERQKRLHPHSHIITTYAPQDAYMIEKGAIIPTDELIPLKDDPQPKPMFAKHQMLYSPYLWQKAINAGLGWQTDLSIVHSAHGVASYVSKYLFKDSMNTRFPSGWRRIRYSRNFPKMPTKEVEAIPLVHHQDWIKLKLDPRPAMTRDRIVAKIADMHIEGKVKRSFQY